jgi:hypothetical protein
MTLRIVSPAPIVETLELYMDQGRAKPIDMKAAVLQLARSRSDGYFVGDEFMAAAMYYPLAPERPGEDLRELVFVCKPDFAEHMLAFIRSARSTRASLAKDGPVRVRAHVRAGHLPGHRLAVLCGMSLVGVTGSLERFEFEGQPDVAICERDQIALHRA